MITFGDVDCSEKENAYMFYDAFILYTDDPIDVGFAFEIKKVMEERFFFKVSAFKKLRRLTFVKITFYSDVHTRRFTVGNTV